MESDQTFKMESLSISTIDSTQSFYQTENYLQLSRDVVNALVQTEETQMVQLNKGQCKLLKEKLLQTMRRIGEDLDSLACTELAIFTQRCKGAVSYSQGYGGHHTQLFQAEGCNQANKHQRSLCSGAFSA